MDVYDDLAICELKGPQVSGLKAQIRSHAEAPTTGVVSRDRFVALVTNVENEVMLSWAEAAGSLKPSQALRMVSCRILQEPIGAVDVELTTTLTLEGMQTEHKDTATGKVTRSANTWDEMYK